MKESRISPAIITYHEVMPKSSYSYCVTTAAFKNHLRLLCDLQKMGRAWVHLTFDDGEQSQYVAAFSLLAERGLKATFFVTPGLVGSESRFLSWAQLRELQSAGHSIQSHGWSHKFLPFCDERELADELRGSKELLEDKLGRAVRGISAPGGRWDDRVVEACARVGYRRLYVSEPWVSTEMCGVRVRGRFMVRRSTTAKQLQRVVLGEPCALWLLRARSSFQKKLTSVIGEGIYHRLWCRFSGYDEFEKARQKQYG